MRYEAVSVYVNNEPNRAIVREARWGGRTVLDFGIATAENLDAAQGMADLLNIDAERVSAQAKVQALRGRYAR